LRAQDKRKKTKLRSKDAKKKTPAAVAPRVKHQKNESATRKIAAFVFSPGK
jgi:hypothetical protein